MPVIKIENLKYKYPGTDKLVINDISLEIEKGEFIGIVGANGAGKSTLSQAIIGLAPQFYKGAYGGKITLDIEGRLYQSDNTPVAELCKHVGLIFQNPFNQMSGAKDTVYGEVAFGLQNLGIEREEMKRRIENVLKQLDIWQYKDRNPFDLSGGQMQRVAIASILVMQPEIIILDEPTSQLDPQGTEEVFKVVDQLAQSGITIIMIEQKLEKIADFCDKIILMQNGQVVGCDTPEKIFSRDDLEEIGVQPPVYTRICKKFDIKNKDGFYPATFKDTKSLWELHNLIFQKKDAWELIKNDSSVINSDRQEIIELQDMSFSYLPEVPIFEHLNLKFDNRTTAIIGQNGAGKTTLVRIVKGLLKPVSGTVLFGKEDSSKKTVAMLASKIGYVFQNPDDQIFKHKVIDEVMFGPLNIGMDEQTAKDKAVNALETMGLVGKEDENPYDLDLHERKMVAIASVLAMDTDVVILDEPTIAQDYEGRCRIGEMICKLSSQGKLVITIIHDMDFVAKYFERVIVMAHGNVLLDGTVEEVFDKNEVLAEARLQKPYMLQLCNGEM